MPGLCLQISPLLLLLLHCRCLLARSYSEQLGKWIEVGNSGMFRPEMLRPMGLPEGVNVIAWGLGLERCAGGVGGGGREGGGGHRLGPGPQRCVRVCAGGGARREVGVGAAVWCIPWFTW